MQISVAILVGVNRIKSYIERIFKAFKTRVLSYPNSIFEAELCLVATLKSLNAIGLLDNASLVTTPNAYNEGVLYSVIPNTTLGDMTVVRATTATRVNASGLIESVAVNIPRIDYTNGSCPSLLVEPQRTNLITYSEQFDNGSWSKSGCTVGSESVSSPSGVIGVSRVTNTALFGRLSTFKDLTNAVSYSYSFWCKNINITTPLSIQLINSGIAIDTFTPTSEWVKYVFTWTSSSTLTERIAIQDKIGSALGSYMIWGAQLEVGSYATSYIPTVGFSVTRNADVISKTGISSLIGQTEGALFVDCIVNNIQNSSTNILNTNKTPSTSSQIALAKVKSTNKIKFDQFFGAGTFDTIPLLSTNAFADGIRTKIAVRYKSGDFAMYINGNLEATSSLTFTNIGTKSELFLNDATTYYSFQESVSFNSAQFYKTALTDAQCISLTTL